MRVSFDGVDTEQDGPLAVVAPAGTVHGFRFDEGTTGWVLTLPSDFTARAEGPGDPLQNLLLRGGQLALDPAAALRVAWLAGEMLVMQETARAQAPLRRAMAEALVRSLVLPDDVAQDAQSPQPRLERFRQLVEAHYREHRDLDFYAAALGMTRRSLSRLTAARLGCSPITVLHRRLATEARRLLRYTGASAAQIAAELGFEDPSYFSRFYLRMTGKRPGDERA
ncbi:MAG: AraC family transcriptional regulator [Novosphingobium sp.]